MAQAYRVRLLLMSPLATPLHSGTLFGHLCWAWRALHGEESLVGWLASQPDDPLLISDAMPKDELPRPLLAPCERAGKRSPVEIEVEKRVRKTTHVSKQLFLRLRDGLDEASLTVALFGAHQAQAAKTPVEPGRLSGVRHAHNSINRLTGRTPETGGLYFTEDEWAEGEARYRDIYVSSSLSAGELRKMFELTGRWGYGRDGGTGRGQFEVTVEAEESGLFRHAGNRRMSLSHGSLTANMAEPRYRLETHYGKLGGMFANTATPFKYPLCLLRPGATFRPAGEGPFGELLDHVHPHRAEIVQNAWHLAVPFTEGKSAR